MTEKYNQKIVWSFKTFKLIRYLFSSKNSYWRLALAFRMAATGKKSIWRLASIRGN